jgi:hypothetical protein
MKDPGVASGNNSNPGASTNTGTAGGAMMTMETNPTC